MDEFEGKSFHEDTDNRTMVEMAKSLIELDDKVDEMEKELKLAKQERDELNRKLAERMMDEEMTQLATQDKTLYIATRNYYSALAETREELMQLLKTNGYEAAVKESVHPQTLGSICSELTNKGEEPLPEWIADKINHYSETKVTIRRK